MPLAVVLILLVVGSLIFHVLSPWTFTELASNWAMVDFTIDITFWVTGAVFVAVNLFMAYCVIKFRYKKEARATYEPENKKLETWLTVLTTIGVAAMLTPGLFVWLYRWLTFRVMFGAGLIKIRGDDCWRELTCLATHYETQPIPNPLSWWLHHQPLWFHQSGVLFNHVVELFVPLMAKYRRKGVHA